MATASTINFVTWNINGLKQKKYQKLEELYNADVVFLQETHIGVGDACSLDTEDEWKVYFTQYMSSQKGAAILVRKTLDFESLSEDKDINGSYLVLKCKIESQPYTLVSVYNHHTDLETLDTLSKYLQDMASGVLVIGGDFNTVLNPFIDKETECNPRKVAKNRSHNKLRCCVERFMKSLQLVDVWRRMNPTTRNYTFNKNNIMSRLDFFFMPEECMWRIKQCEINNLQRPDHHPLVMEVSNVAVIYCRKDLEIHYIGQLLQHKRLLGIVETDLCVNEYNLLGISEIDIVTAIQSLQVSDTPRPDGIPVSFYKEMIRDLIPYLKVLYSKMFSDSFDFRKTCFCDSVQEPFSGEQHFFNVDYLIIATILARRLNDHLESQSKGEKPNDSGPYWITFKTFCPKVKWSYIQKVLNEQKLLNFTLHQDIVVLGNLLRNTEYTEFSPETYKQLFLGCPLTPVLMTLMLKSVSSNQLGHLEQHRIIVCRQSLIIWVKPEDQNHVEHKLVEVSNYLDISHPVALSRGNRAVVLDEDAEFYTEEEDVGGSYFEQDISEGESDYKDSETEDTFHENGPEWIPTIQHRQTMYAVVILNTSMEVMVIPKIWLTNGKKETYWPPFKSPTKFTEAVKNQFPPDTLTPGQQWEKIYITYIGEHGSFDEAKKIREMFTGSKPQVKSPSTSGDTPLKRRKLNEAMGLNPPEMFLGTSQSTLTSTFTPPSIKHLQSHSSKTGLKEVMGMLQEINQKVQDNSEMLNELLKRVDRAGQPCSSKILSETFTPKLPLTDLSEVNRIEEDLKDYTIKQHYIQYLSKHGKQGIGHKDMIRRIMESVMRDDFADKFNWQGRNQKTGLSALTLSTVIKAAGRQCGIHDAVSEKEIKIWLRKATDRNARKKIKNLRDCELDCGSPAVTSLSDNMIF